jgi:hypothetical protein
LARAELRDALRLSAIPVGAALLFGVLLLPRRASPDDVPVPVADTAALAHARAADQELAEAARRDPLPGTVRALGSALRGYHTLEAAGAAGEPLAQARRAIEGAREAALAAGDGALLELRAVQLEGFLQELRRFESRGVESDELQALGGRFVHALTDAGWCHDHALVPSEPALRTLFKEMWNGLVGVEAKPAFAPTLDEERALYALYLEHPHPAPARRVAIAAALQGAHDARACEDVRLAEVAAIEDWRLQRIARLAAIDPAYPASFARGVSSYRRGDYRAAAASFRQWLTDHPDGPLTLRAQAFLRAASADAE